MGSIVDVLSKLKLINPPIFLKNNVHYEVQMGSVAYGVSNNNSDIDVYGFCIPPKHIIFPHLNGEILGFGKQIKRFEQFQQHHILDSSTNKEYDLSIYNIVKYFQLVMENNPNMIDSLFVPRRCILHSTQIGEYIRENRRLFLHKGSWHKFKGYAYSQVHKMNIKKPEVGSNRYDMYITYGYDLKFAYHVVRLLNEIEQILVEHNLDLERNREQLKSIRRGEWTKEQIIAYFETKEHSLESAYLNSTLPHKPNEEKIKELLLYCLEMHYGNIDNAIKTGNIDIEKSLSKIEQICNTIRKTIFRKTI